MAPMSLSELKLNHPVQRVTPDYPKHQTETTTKQTTQKGGGSHQGLGSKLVSPTVLDLGSPLMFNRSPTRETPDSRTHINTPLLPFSPTSDFHDSIRVARPEELIIFARCSAESSTSKTCLTFFHDRPRPLKKQRNSRLSRPFLFLFWSELDQEHIQFTHTHIHTRRTSTHTPVSTNPWTRKAPASPLVRSTALHPAI